jgi:hypothetical protein
MIMETNIKRLREGRYMAEVEVELRQHPGRDYATLSLDDVRRLERVRKALARGDLKAAAADAQLFLVEPLDAPSNAA